MKLQELNSGAEENSTTAFYIGLSDLMVLLLVFFLMLISMSKIDKGSFEKIKAGFTGSTKGTLVELASQLKEIVEGQPGIPGVKVHLAEDGVRLDLDTGALFDSGSAKLKDNAIDPLMPILNIIKSTSYTIDVEGHTDDAPMHRIFKIDGIPNLENNWSLSGRRASSVINVLLEEGFDGSRLRIVGYADTRPIQEVSGIQDDDLEAARALNRRVSLLIK
ncbi:OmpA/MotB family protein [Oligoflexus tunisiensis]|uniref:OmpA/MotB family protein n=1 Tax=Oligoflexus tunisiensis TaxID=708132 RepID=UPI00114CF9AC|nr:OmpA family protein [Oligoflexus tunisiensis]